MIIPLNSLSGILLISILSLWPQFCPVLSFGPYSSVPPFYLTLCVCFYALRKSATFPAFENSDPMKKSGSVL